MLGIVPINSLLKVRGQYPTITFFLYMLADLYREKFYDIRTTCACSALAYNYPR